MTSREADKLIKANKPVLVHDTWFDEKFIIVPIKQDRHDLYTASGGCFSKSTLQVMRN